MTVIVPRYTARTDSLLPKRTERTLVTLRAAFSFALILRCANAILVEIAPVRLLGGEAEAGTCFLLSLFAVEVESRTVTPPGTLAQIISL